MTRVLLAALLALPLVAGRGLAGQAEGTLDPARLVGEWEFVTGVAAGEMIPAERLPKRLIVTKETMTLPTTEGQFVFTYRVDATASPARIDLKMKESPIGATEGVTKGLLRLDGEQLTLGYAEGSANYPAKLDSTPATGLRLFVLKKAR